MAKKKKASKTESSKTIPTAEALAIQALHIQIVQLQIERNKRISKVAEKLGINTEDYEYIVAEGKFIGKQS